jgi:hypothetical protein
LRRLGRTELLLILACAGATGMLAASQFMDIFELTPPGGEAVEAIDAADQHGHATLVLAIFAFVMLMIALVSLRSERSAGPLALFPIAALAVAICGVVALLIFLIGDLPDLNSEGTVDDERESFVDAKAEPQAGFWFELVGSLVLTVCGAALVATRPEVTKPAQPSGGQPTTQRRREPSLARTQEGRARH